MDPRDVGDARHTNDRLHKAAEARVRGRQEERDTLMQSETSESGTPADGSRPADDTSGADDTASLPVPMAPPSAAGAESGSEPAGPTGINRMPPGTLPDGRVRTAELIAGEYLVGVNAPDGSTVEVVPPARHPAAEALRRAAGTQAAAGSEAATARPAPAVSPEAATLRLLPPAALLERESELQRLRTLLAQGRSIRVTGPAGSGRTVLLDAVAAAVTGLAPAGVVRLSGRRRTAADLLQELFAATAPVELRGGPGGRPRFRPDRAQLVSLLRPVGAIVVVDDVEFGGAALEELLDAASECAFLVSAAPDVPAPLPDSRMEEVALPGLSREAGLRLLAERAGRPLEEPERAWGVDLWFESEGLPLRFVQAATLLRHRDAAIAAIAAGLPAPEWRGPGAEQPNVDFLHPRAAEDADAPAGPLALPGGRVPPGFAGGVPDRFDDPDGGPDSAADPAETVPLPSVAESAAPAVRVARGLGSEAQRLLRLAVALGGEIPTAPHLPALLDTDQPEPALRELLEAGLAAPSGRHHRLVEGVREPLAAEWPDPGIAQDAAQHFAWWTGHSSVTPELIAAEAEVLLAVMRADQDAGRHGSVALLARAAAPSFAIALDWNAWERALRFGLAAARATGAVAEEAWFHHELGVLGFCTGASERARAELEAAVALRGALGETRGSHVGRQVLDLLDAATARRALAPGHPSDGAGASRTRGLRRIAVLSASSGGPLLSRRNVAAAASGAVLLGALASAVALGTGTHGPGAGAGMNVGPAPSASTPAQAPGDSASPSAGPSGTPSAGGSSRAASATAHAGATAHGTTGATPGGGATGTGPGPTGGAGTGGDPGPSKSPTAKPTTSRPTTPAPTSSTPDPTPSQTVTPTPTATATTTAASGATSASAGASGSSLVTPSATGGAGSGGSAPGVA